MNNPKKILIIHLEHIPIANFLEIEFKKLGIEVFKFYTNQNTWQDKVFNKINKLAHSLKILPKNRNFFETHPMAHRNFLDTKLSKLYEDTKPDLVFAIRGMDACTKVIKQMDCVKIGWFIEKETDIHQALNEANFFDWYFCMSERGIEIMKNGNYEKTSYMHHAVSSDSFYPAPLEQKKYDLCFVGAANKRRSEYIDAAMSVTKNIAIYGPNWLAQNFYKPSYWSCYKGKYISGIDLNRLYNRSKLVLNVSLWEGVNGQAPSGMNMRLMEVPASGACLISERNLETDKFFEVETDIITFNTIDDFKTKLKYYLENKNEIDIIARNGYGKVAQNYTYANLVNYILIKYQEIIQGEDED